MSLPRSNDTICKWQYTIKIWHVSEATWSHFSTLSNTAIQCVEHDVNTVFIHDRNTDPVKAA